MRPLSARARLVFPFLVMVPWPVTEANGQQTAPTRCFTQSESSLRTRLHMLLDSAGIPGISLAMVSGAKTTHVFSLGWRDSTGGKKVDANTVFEAASLSKPVIAYAALKLVDAGKLDLDRPISAYVGIPELGNDPRANRITARMILNHTSGLQNERIGNEALAISFDPGSKFQYSGEGYTLLGRVIAQLSGVALDVAINRLVLRPLGMNRSSFVWQKSFDDDGAVGHGEYGDIRHPTRPTSARAPSGLQTTAADYAKFVSAILNAEALSKKAWRTMTTPIVHITTDIDWGLGWGVEIAGRDTLLWHHGDNSNSGFTAFTLLDPRSKCGIVYFANSTRGLSIAPEIASIVRGTHPSVEWINYERYNAPARLARLRLYQTFVRNGIAEGLSNYASLRKQNPAVAPESLLNNLGYLFLARGQIKTGLALFQENQKEFPTSANAYDSLGDGYLAAGDTVAAVRAYDESVKLDSTNTHARKLANELRRLH